MHVFVFNPFANVQKYETQGSKQDGDSLIVFS